MPISIAAYQAFLIQNGISGLAQDAIDNSYCLAIENANTYYSPCTYANIVYNLGAHFVVFFNLGSTAGVPNPSVDAIRKNCGLNNVASILSNSEFSDNGTSGKMLSSNILQDMSIFGLYLTRTPFGRNAQQLMGTAILPQVG